MKFLSVFVAAISTLLAHSAFALDVKITSKGDLTSFTVPSSDTKSVRFYFLSSGNISQMVDLNINGPASSKVSVRAAKLGNGGEAAALNSSVVWNPLTLFTYAGKEVKSHTFGAAKTSAGIFDCTGLSAQAIQNLIAIYEATYHQKVTVEQLCGNAAPPPQTPGSPPPGTTTARDVLSDNSDGSSNSGAQYSLLLSKDSCTSAKQSNYIVAIEFDLSKVDASSTPETLNVSAQVRNYDGSKASSIKPVSEGQFAPRPLILMSSVNGGSNERFRLVSWKSGKVRSARQFKVVKNVFYRGQILSAGLVGPYLKGGKGTFELTNGRDAYSVCFSLTRSRQRANGYQN